MSARWVTWIDDEAATVELVERGAGHVVARIESGGEVREVREVRFEIALERDNGERLVRLADGRTRSVWVGVASAQAHARGERVVSIEGRDVAVRARRELDTWLGVGDDGAGSGAVTVAMPGRVVKLLARAGDAVEKGQALLIVEAMKMENEIPAPIDGIVKEIAVSEGQTVEAGATLFVVAPAGA